MSTLKQITMTEDEFNEKYNPVKNHLNSDAAFDGFMFETYGPEVDHIRKLNSNTDTERKIWTIIEVEGNMYYLSGFHFVNRFGYLVTEELVPEYIEIEVKLDTEIDGE